MVPWLSYLRPPMNQAQGGSPTRGLPQGQSFLDFLRSLRGRGMGNHGMMGMRNGVTPGTGGGLIPATVDGPYASAAGTPTTNMPQQAATPMPQMVNHGVAPMGSPPGYGDMSGGYFGFLQKNGRMVR